MRLTPTTTLLATLLATAPLAVLAQDCSSVVCVLGDGACKRVCEMEGHPEGGKCIARDGCPAGSEVCVCGAKKIKMKRGGGGGGVVSGGDGDVLLERALQGVGASVDEFVDAVFEKRDGDAGSQAAGVEKRSVCCSFPDPVGGLCCEAHCSQIGHPEGGQCTANNVCVCG